MQYLKKLIFVEIKMFIREPIGAFFTLMFPSMLLLIFGTIWGNTPSEYFGGVGYVDTAVPAFTAMIIATSGLMSLSIDMATYRDRGILRRLKITPVKPLTLLVAQVVVIFLMSIAGMAVLIVLGKLLYNLRILGNIFQLLLGFIFCSASFFGLGFLLAGTMPTARAAQVVSMVIFYPMLFLSGSAIPREVLPETIRRVAQFIPLTHVVNLLRGLAVGDSWLQHQTAVLFLGIMLIVSAAISAKIFRWE